MNTKPFFIMKEYFLDSLKTAKYTAVKKKIISVTSTVPLMNNL